MWSVSSERVLRAALMYVYVIMTSLDVATCNGTTSILLDDLLTGYDKRFPPEYKHVGSKKQVEIGINIYVNSMFDISEMNMDYSMGMFLRERWVDKRLAYGPAWNITRFELGAGVRHKIWVPDVYVLNEKEARFHPVTVPNEMVHIYPDGTVQLSIRVTGTYSCQMFLQKYPFDTQVCYLDIESYSKSTESLLFKWRDNAVTIADGISFPQFVLEKSTTYTCNKEYYGITFPCIGVKFVLRRDFSYYLTQIYIPSTLVVLLSWMNFWLDTEAVPARISLGLLTILTVTTQSSGARASLPRVSYVKAIDVWMAACLVFVFLALIEFAYVNVLSRKMKRQRESILQKQQQQQQEKQQHNHPHHYQHNNHQQHNNSEKPEIVKNGSVKPELPQISMLNICKRKLDWFEKLASLDRARFVDRVSRIAFPSSFLLFNIIYWVFYFLWDPEFGVPHA